MKLTRCLMVAMAAISAAVVCAPGCGRQQPVAPAGKGRVVRVPFAGSPRDIFVFRFTIVGSSGEGRLQMKLSESPGDVNKVWWMHSSEGFRQAVQQQHGQTVALTDSPTPDMGKFFQWLMGDMMTTQQLEQMKLVRVQVTEIDAKGKGTVRVGAQVAARLKPGSTIFLFRPHPGLDEVPEVLPVADGRSPAMRQQQQVYQAITRSMNNLKQIGLAMHSFYDMHGYFPPAVIDGPDGKPWHSWRVLLLPLMGETQLYDQYRFDEPWDGPHNKQLIAQVPSVYRDPSYGETHDGYTHYAVAVGTGTAFPPEGYKLPANPPPKLDLPKRPQRGRGRERVPGTTRMADFRDGYSNSLLVGSVSPERKIPWTKPEDVVFDEHFPGLDKPGGFAAPYKTAQGAGGVFLFADTTVHTIRDDADPEVMRRLLLIADGQRVETAQLPSIAVPYGPQALPVLELNLGGPHPSARLVLQPLPDKVR